jgi:uncharacterized protein GlcG (DUF336 family)
MPADSHRSADRTRCVLRGERLEPRDVPASATLAAGALTVTGDPTADRIRVYLDGASLVVIDRTAELGRFASASVTSININAGDGNDTVIIDCPVTQPVTIDGGPGDDRLVAGGGPAVLNGGAGNDSLFGGLDSTTFNGGAGSNQLFKVKGTDIVFPNAGDTILTEDPADGTGAQQQTITAAEVNALLQRAAAASASTDAIIAITDRLGRILGVRVESGVDPAITGNNEKLVFAVDGAVALARTGAFFGNDQAPLTSRTIQDISQSTITQREVESDPSITDPNSTLRGPGFVAAVGVKAHFPPGIAFTPQVDLFQIEHTNRDATFTPGPDRIKGTPDDIPTAERFNADPAFVPGASPGFTNGAALPPPDSFGFVSGLAPGSQSRGIGTLPGGIPIFKNGQVVGGIGVFFPGKTGFATEENSSLSSTFDPTKPDRSLEAEWMAFAALGGTRLQIETGGQVAPINDLGGVPLPAGFGLPTGRIDLVGITLDIFGQGGQEGTNKVLAVGAVVGRGDPNNGTNLMFNPATDLATPSITSDGGTIRDGLPAPDGWLVLPHDGVGISKADVERIITQGITQSNLTRAAIRLPLGTRAKFVFAVADLQGNIVGLYREPDATIFSIDVAVAKARNVAYYANANELQTIDQIQGVPPGTAFTNRTFRYAGQPRFPEAIDGAPPGPFSQLNDDPGIDRNTGLQVGPRLPASAFQSVVGYDSFNPGTNFHDPFFLTNQDGIVFFPGSAPLYKSQTPGGPIVLAGGFGVSGDGVDQDDVTTISGQSGFDVPAYILRADQVLVNGVRLPYQKTNRNPEG